ncbi:MAG TPA: SNF2-related protein [Parachlamydiaceae bacterium]|nr:SNF2-related protein [Parachlamydiaceae bacterium]
MLNFRKLKQDFPPGILKEGKQLADKKMVLSAKIVNLSATNVRIACQVQGSFDNAYESEIEIERRESTLVDSNCDCPYKYDCQHLAAILFYLEEHFDSILIEYSKEADLEQSSNIDEEEKNTLIETIKEAETKEIARRGKKYQKEVLQEYVGAAELLGKSPFFLPENDIKPDRAELAVIFSAAPLQAQNMRSHIEVQLALRLPFRSKPLNILNIKEFLDAVRYQEPLYIGSKRYFFAKESFDEESWQVLKFILDFARFPDLHKEDRNLRVAVIDPEAFGVILSKGFELAENRTKLKSTMDQDGELQTAPCLYIHTLEEPLKVSPSFAVIRFELEYLETFAPKILLNPALVINQGMIVPFEEIVLFECANPGMIHQNIYFRFAPNIKRKHLRNLSAIREVTIPEPLFGSFVENSLPELMHFAEVTNKEIIERFVTLPFVGQLGAECEISYLNGELEARLEFIYDGIKVSASASHLVAESIFPFITNQGILARNLAEEQKIIHDLFQDFIYDPVQGLYLAKNDKKIVEFMTETIPQNTPRVKFNCPENLLDQFIYDETRFKLHLRATERIDVYELDLKVDGHLKGVTLDLLWECVSSKKAFIELPRKMQGKKRASSDGQGIQKGNKILVLDLEKLLPVVQIFDDLGINNIDDHTEERPLWSLASIEPSQFEGLQIDFSMTDKLKAIQDQMVGMLDLVPKEIPKNINATLRSYQIEGVGWLERLRSMHLSGVLADDMGLGKTLQAIAAVTQFKKEHKNALSIIVCPTSLVYNWKEEFLKFNKMLRILAVDGTPTQRKRLLNDIKDFDVVITSYSLLQKDIEFYKQIPFGYCILDEAQAIKNRGTRNAKSVKMLQAVHRLILTGTPIENSLDELWSLFDFLMPGLLSSYDRFLEKYIRNPNTSSGNNLDVLKRKISPFILRRMKKDVLSELPDVAEIVYRCHLSEVQQELYQSYARSAREELSHLVKKEGFEKVQIHVLATLTRLKQICCHPAIFAKEKPEIGDSSKYDMLIELLQTLMEGGHKTVIFSQYTRMLSIMRHDLEKKGIRFEYLDGSSKNRLSIVKKFNEDQNIPVFLVSLKAGGTGLNLVGADTVIHYDMWWNPAVENQATDRVHRIGQKNSVSSYKLVTANTIEEKILELQNRKRGLVKKVISSDEEAISKLTWEEVLELLQT